MTTKTQTRSRKPEPILEQLPPELLEAVDGTRGETPREDWIRATVEERIQRERQDSEPVADLDETPKRAHIRFRGKVYELRNLTEFGPLEQHALNRDGQEFSDIWRSDEELADPESGVPTNKGARLTMLVERLFAKVLDAPEDVREQFTAGQRAQVVLSFTVAPARQLAELARLVQQIAAQQPGSESV